MLKSSLLFVITILGFYFGTYAQDTLPQKGIATYYGSRFHGRKTYSGERHDKKGFMAAHPWLPMKTLVKVTNLKNNKSVVVKINDRCPRKKKRIIDLSNAAAKELDIFPHGTAEVLVELYVPPLPCDSIPNDSIITR